MEEIRLQKYLSQCGIASRRKAEQLMLSGAVTVNNVIADKLGMKVTEKDIVKVNDKIVKPVKKKIYIMLNKPEGIVTTLSDTHNRKTVLDIVGKDLNERVFPVGRLDMDTEGLLFLTNDGDLAYTLTHPKHEVNKTYIASLNGKINNEQLRKLESGVIIDGIKTAPAKANVIKDYAGRSDVKITIHEGRNRQVRKMFESVGLKVIELKRIAIGNIQLGHLPLGRWRHLTKDEIGYLKQL